MPSRSRLLPAGVAAAAVLVAGRCLRGPAFAPPRAGREAAAALAAAVVASATLAAPEPAAAEGTKFSFFGFGNGYSDAYGQLDADQPNPYNQFSNPKDRIFKQDDPVYMDRAKTALKESFQRLEKVPKLIKGKESENLKSLLTLQLYTMRANMEYVTAKGTPFYRSEDQTTPAWKKVNALFDDLGDLGAFNREKIWPKATESYQSAMKKLGEWKELVQF